MYDWLYITCSFREVLEKLDNNCLESIKINEIEK